MQQTQQQHMKHTARVLIKIHLCYMSSYICWRHSYRQHAYLILNCGMIVTVSVYGKPLVPKASHCTSVDWLTIRA